MPYKDAVMKSQRQKERRKGEAPIKVKPLGEAPVTVLDDKGNLHPIMYAIADPVKREKLRKVCISLKAHKVLEKVNYGIRPMSMPGEVNIIPTMEKVEKLLDAV